MDGAAELADRGAEMERDEVANLRMGRRCSSGTPSGDHGNDG
jgi:hypothetical protein